VEALEQDQMEWHRDEFVISDDPKRVSIDVVAGLLAKTYWGHKRSRPVLEKLIPKSFCFSLLQHGVQIGFARVVTDFTVFSWLSDLVIDDSFRGRGLGRWFLECILNHPEIGKTQFVLQTTHAHGLYEKFGFQGSEKIMSRLPGMPPG
jgi:GNAT superfamily N-acetyltransferase